MVFYWVLAATLFVTGAYLIALNFYGWLYLGLAKKEHHSPIAFLGGVLCALSLLILASTRRWFWVPLLLDPGCVYLVGVFIYSLIATKGFR